jgi:lipopolysaccharide exporter
LTTVTIEVRPDPGAVVPPSHNPESVGRSIARGGLALFSVQPLTWGASLLSTALLPRLLGSDMLGEVSIATTFIAIVATACGLGISEFLVRRAAQQPHTLRRDQGTALVVQMIAAGLGFGAVLLFGWLFARSIIDYRLLLFAAPVMLVAPAQTVLLSSFRGREQHRNYAWFCATTSVLCMVGGVVTLLLGGDAIAFLAVSAIMLATTTLAGWKLSGLRPRFPRPSALAMSEAWEFIRAGFPFVCWQITQLAYSQIDRLLLGLLVPASQVGWYVAANRFVAIPIFIPTLIVTPLFPALSRSAHQPELLRRTIAQTVRFTLLVMVPLSAGTIVLAPVVPTLLGWPPDFANTALPTSVLALQLPLVALGMVLGTVLMAIGRERRLVVIAIVATGFNIALNFLAIPALQTLTGNGGIGAAIVTVASEILMLIGALVLTPRHLLDIRIVWDAARITLAGAATAIVGVTLLPMGLFVCVPAGAATYVTLTGLLRVLTIEDVRLVASRLRNR